MQLRDTQAFLAEVDAGDLGAAARHRLGEDAAAAADVEHLLAGEAGGAVDPFQAQRVDLVQRPEFALGVPPAVCELRKLLELCGVGVHAPILETKNPAGAGFFVGDEREASVAAGGAHPPPRAGGCCPGPLRVFFCPPPRLLPPPPRLAGGGAALRR